MRLNSTLLYDLARSVDVDKLTEFEQLLVVPPNVVPVAELALFNVDQTVFSVIEPQRTSVVPALSTVIRTNQVETSVQHATLGQGLWDLYLEFWQFTNFDAFTASGNGGDVRLADPANNQRPIMMLPPTANRLHSLTRRFRLLLPADGWALHLHVFTTGVGQTTHAQLGSVLTKLL